MKKIVARLVRRSLGLLLAAGLLLGGGVTAWADAVSTYSLSMKQGTLSVLKGGYVTNSFRTSSSDLTVVTDVDGNLMVCFYDSKGEYVGVTLGSQQIVNFYGSIGTLHLDESLDRPVVIGAGAQVENLWVEAPVKVSVWGRVNGGDIDAEADIVTAKGSQLYSITFLDPYADLYINEGAVVDGATIRSAEDDTYTSAGRNVSPSRSSSNSSSSTRTVSGGVTLKTSSIYADYDDTLGDLITELEDNVTAYNRSGRRIYGEVEWVESDSTEVEDGGRFRYRFTPDDDDYDTVTGSIRIVVDDDDEESLTLEFDPINISYSGEPRRLSRYLSKLENTVKAYNEDGRRVYGEVKWTSNKKVEESGKYKFTFTPYSSKYRTTKGEIQINVNEE